MVQKILIPVNIPGWLHRPLLKVKPAFIPAPPAMKNIDGERQGAWSFLSNVMPDLCGKDAVMAPWCRVYGPERLLRLLAPFIVEKERFWVKDDQNCWAEVDRQTALNFTPRHDPSNPHGCSYALGGFVLRKSN